MKHLRWISIERIRAKYRSYFLHVFPELAEVVYCITEKIDVSNISICAAQNEPCRIARRNGWVNPGDQFFGVWDVMSRPVYTDVMDKLSILANLYGEEYRLYGELFGPGVRSDFYGSKKRILFYALMIGDELQPPVDFLDFMNTHFTMDLVVPIVGFVEGLDAALATNSEFDTMLNPQSGHMCEGIVITPANKVYKTKGGSTFYLKKVNDWARQKGGGTKPKHKPNTEVGRLQLELANYVTENRLNAVESKFGPIQEPRQIGEYIKYMIADSTEDCSNVFP